MPKRQVPYRSYTVKPVDGALDTRSTPDQIQLGSWRERQSWECLAHGKMCRMSGWKHLCADVYNNNADLHDQLLSIAGGGHVKQPIILLHEAVQPLGLNKLFAATQNRIYALNNSTGNWRVISDQYGGTPQSGCPDAAWWAAGTADIVTFTNGVNKPVYHVVDTPPDAVTQQSVALIPDCESLNISTVGLMFTWNHLTFYANVTQDGAKASYRVLWSDYDRPLSLKPKKSVSLAGFFDMAFGEVILNAAPMGNVLFFYTNMGVWQCSIAGVDQVLSFQKRYDAPRPGLRCLAYARTLISTGVEHYFMSGDGVYVYSYYVDSPQRIDWIHKATAVIYEDLNTGRCNAHLAGYDSQKKQITFWWAKNGQNCAGQGLVLSTEFNFVSTIPYGATAAANFGPNQQYSLRDFLLDKCICTLAGLDAAGGGFVKEGGYCVAQTDRTCSAYPTSFYSNTSVNLDGRMIEDTSQLSADANSLCHLLGNLTVGDVCNAEFSADQCRPVDRFIFASSADYCIKENDPNALYREVCTAFTGCGSYSKLGYRSPLKSGPMDFGMPTLRKLLSMFEPEMYPAMQTIPSMLSVKIGGATRAVDPLAPDCAILYEPVQLIPLKCPDPKTATEHASDGTFGDDDYALRCFTWGENIFLEIDVVNPAAEPVDTGGGVCVSRLTFDVQTRQ